MSSRTVSEAGIRAVLRNILFPEMCLQDLEALRESVVDHALTGNGPAEISLVLAELDYAVARRLEAADGEDFPLLPASERDQCDSEIPY